MFHFISSFFERFSFADSTLPDSPVPSGTLGHFGDTPWGVSEPSVFNGWGSGAQSMCEASSLSLTHSHSVTTETWGSIDSGSSFDPWT